jgi:ribosomal protein S18 acetylase RimI-like enzyme
MEIIRLHSENIEKYMQDCLNLQQQLIKPGEVASETLFIRTASSEHTYMLGLLEGGHIVGLGVIGLLVHPAHVTAHVDNIVVDAAFRGQGYFTIIMDALEAHALEWGADEITLTCSRPLVQPLYLK